MRGVPIEARARPVRRRDERDHGGDCEERDHGVITAESLPATATTRRKRLAEAPDPMAAVLWFMSSASPRGEDQYRRMPLGIIPPGVFYVREHSWWHTEPDTHLLAIGPPRSEAGKTASVIIPTILSALGPVVAASTSSMASSLRAAQ